MNTLEVNKTKIDRVARTVHPIMADESGNAPKSIELLKVGMWRTPNHGDFMITPEDLQEYVANFQNNIGLPGNGAYGAPVDYKHESWDKASGWIKKIYVNGDTLMGEVEWTPAGAKMIIDGEFRFFSPEFYPKGRGGWCNPEDYEMFVDNVLVGGGLTNIPLFKGLAPVKASASEGNSNVGEDKNVIYIKASEVKENQMNLAEILAKDPSTLTDDEKNFLAENKEQLTAEDKVKFGFETAPVANADDDADDKPAPAVAPAEPVAASTDTGIDPSVAASIKSGESVVVKASDLAEMKRQTEAYAREKAEGVVKAHIARGAVKADQLANLTNRLLADATFKDVLETLPSNEVLASEQGTDVNSGSAVSASEQITKLATEKVTASNGTMTITQAISQVRKEHTDLARQADEEVGA